MSEWILEFRYAVRTLAKAPGFTLVAVLSLALGIGVNTAVLAVGRAVLFQPLNVSDPGALVIAYNWRGDTVNGLMQINSGGMKDDATGRSLGGQSAVGGGMLASGQLLRGHGRAGAVNRGDSTTPDLKVGPTGRA